MWRWIWRLSRYSRPERGDGVCTAVYLWGRGAGGGSQRGYNSSAVCGGLARHVLDHTALFLRGLRSCDSAFLSSAWPLDTVNACSTHADKHSYIHRCIQEKHPHMCRTPSSKRDETVSVMYVKKNGAIRPKATWLSSEIQWLVTKQWPHHHYLHSTSVLLYFRPNYHRRVLFLWIQIIASLVK